MMTNTSDHPMKMWQELALTEKSSIFIRRFVTV
jgi:hypothetical protein